MSTNWWTDKQNVVYYTTGYYSALKMNEALIQAVMQMNLENTVIGEKKPDKQSLQTVCFHLYGMSKIGKSIKI